MTNDVTTKNARTTPAHTTNAHTADPKPILVLGSTGKTGRRVLARLRHAGHEVRAGSRRGPTRFDWTDESTWEPALKGVGAAYLVDSQTEDAADSVRAFAQLASARGVERLVLLSANDWVVPEGEEKLPSERAVRESGVAWTIVKPAWFAQNFSEDPYYLGQLRDGEFVSSTGTGREAFVDADDIADVAVAALTEDGHAGETYRLAGPRLLSLDEVVEEIARATDRDIVHRAVPPEDFVAVGARQGLPEGYVNLLDDLYSWIREERFAQLADGVRRALGREPRDFADYVRTTAATGVWHA
ncbi:NAD(P)H-binding protein [Streptomyces sp. NPDC090127]|uniref:NAD(P)H-binding protein n=1 Tax=Streptomyces sp. NPDC090127 TaxID=3365953 RepID=UPI003802556E